MSAILRSFVQERLGLAKYGIGLPQAVILDLHENKKDDGIRETFWDRSRHLELPPITHISGNAVDDPFSRYIGRIPRVEFPSPSIVEIDDAWLYGDSLLFTNPTHDATILLNARYQEKALRRVQKKALKPYKKVTLEQPAYLTFDNWANCYYHWLIDILPRMLSVADRIRKDGGVLLLPPKVSGWMTEALELVGLADLPTFRLDAKTRYTVPTLFCPLKMNRRTASNPLAIELLKNAMNMAAPQKSVEKTERLFISRAKAPSRLVKNEDDLFARLETHGFKKIFSEDYDFRAKQELFAKTEIVVAPHGSGLTNIMFCQPGAAVVALMQEDFYDEAFYVMARNLGLDFYHETTAVDATGTITVDVDGFMKHFETRFGKTD